MIIFFVLSIVALKEISEPPELASFNVIKLSILVSVKAVSSVFLTASSNVIVILESAAIPVAESAGLKVTLGASTSAVVKFKVVASDIPA